MKSAWNVVKVAIVLSSSHSVTGSCAFAEDNQTYVKVNFLEFRCIKSQEGTDVLMVRNKDGKTFWKAFGMSTGDPPKRLWTLPYAEPQPVVRKSDRYYTVRLFENDKFRPFGPRHKRGKDDDFGSVKFDLLTARRQSRIFKGIHSGREYHYVLTCRIVPHRGPVAEATANGRRVTVRWTSSAVRADKYVVIWKGTERASAKGKATVGGRDRQYSFTGSPETRYRIWVHAYRGNSDLDLSNEANAITSVLPKDSQATKRKIAWYFFKLTNPHSRVNPCFVTAVMAPDAKTARRLAHSQAANYSIKQITAAEYSNSNSCKRR